MIPFFSVRDKDRLGWDRVILDWINVYLYLE